jgi:hypothetical protein
MEPEPYGDVAIATTLNFYIDIIYSSLEVGFPFRILFLFRETRNKAKQKNCFAKFRLFLESVSNADPDPQKKIIRQCLIINIKSQTYL